MIASGAPSDSRLPITAVGLLVENQPPQHAAGAFIYASVFQNCVIGHACSVTDEKGHGFFFFFFQNHIDGDLSAALAPDRCTVQSVRSQ